MKCILHVGAHKTGSTAIQNALLGYDDGEFIYADMGEPNHSIAFRTLFAADRFESHWTRLGESAVARRNHYESRLAEALEVKRSGIIFSGESISELSSVEMQEMRCFLESRCTSFEVVMFVRDPAEWAASFIQERAKHGAVEFSVVDEPGFEERYRNLLGAFGKEEIKVRKYESAKGDIVDFFLKLIGLHRGALQREPIVTNASISLEALRTLQLFNSLGISIRRGELLESAHWRFVLCVADIFRAGTRSAAGQFAHLCKLSDYVFLREELGICYEDPSASTSQNCSLSDFDPAILSGIGDYLRARSFQEVADLNTAISYLYAYSLSSEIAVRGHLESLGATLPPILIAESEPLRRDASTHRSKLAGQIEYLDFCVHDALSKIPFAPKGFRVRFAEAARKRFRDCYKRG